MQYFGRRSLLQAIACLALLGWISVGSLGLQACGTPGDTKQGCKSDADCNKEAKYKICDKNRNKCVQCLDSSHCGKSEVCNPADYTCSAGCSTDADCKDAFKDRPKAKVACRSQKCTIKCDTKADCKVDERCSDNQCIENTCAKTEECGKGEKCDGGKCVPAKKLSGKYQACSSVDDCEEGLICVTYKGGTSNYCWKPCDKGCDKDTEVCVKEASFAEGYNVCMKAVKEEGATFDYDSGTACAEGRAIIQAGGINFGSCWKDCQDKCLGGKKCLPHPGIQDDTKKFCFTACKADSDCAKGVSCKEHKKANGDFYCIP